MTGLPPIHAEPEVIVATADRLLGRLRYEGGFEGGHNGSCYRCPWASLPLDAAGREVPFEEVANDPTEAYFRCSLPGRDPGRPEWGEYAPCSAAEWTAGVVAWRDSALAAAPVGTLTVATVLRLLDAEARAVAEGTVPWSTEDDRRRHAVDGTLRRLRAAVLAEAAEPGDRPPDGAAAPETATERPSGHRADPLPAGLPLLEAVRSVALVAGDGVLDDRRVLAEAPFVAGAPVAVEVPFGPTPDRLELLDAEGFPLAWVRVPHAASAGDVVTWDIDPVVVG